IVATVGPASREPQVLREMFLSGVNVVRLNFSHGTHDEHRAVIEDVRRTARDLDVHVAILQDLPGPKVRTGPLNGSASVRLETGAAFTLTTRPEPGDATRVSVSYRELPRDVEAGKSIYLQDGAISLRIDEVTDEEVRTHVEVGGDLRPTQGINYPDGTLQIESVTERDFEHLAFGLEMDVDWVGVSFVRTPEDVLRVKAFIGERGHDAPVMAKIEKHEALEHIDEIIDVADGIMVARGDLGIEIPLEQVPLIQKDLIERANRSSKPVVTATQMLESMINSARPTRAEANDVANAILDGTDAVMLSGETARGMYPLEAVKVMATIASEVEKNYPHEEMKARRLEHHDRSTATAIAQAAAQCTEELALRSVITGTTTGSTARHISAFRPRAQIYAITPKVEVARRLAVNWGVEALVVQPYKMFETMLELAEARLLSDGLAELGEVVAFTSGMPVGVGATNILKLHRLE
ncbi:MAG: pyruvate kinase, partial [Candidatus Eremiobacteraeota bacterium]|nr:pyruvate kinase [Candidatus Eremiobacteraeota bacterium]